MQPVKDLGKIRVLESVATEVHSIRPGSHVDSTFFNPFIFPLRKVRRKEGWGCSSAVERMFSKHRRSWFGSLVVPQKKKLTPTTADPYVTQLVRRILSTISTYLRQLEEVNPKLQEPKRQEFVRVEHVSVAGLFN